MNFYHIFVPYFFTYLSFEGDLRWFSFQVNMNNTVINMSAKVFLKHELESYVCIHKSDILGLYNRSSFSVLWKFYVDFNGVYSNLYSPSSKKISPFYQHPWQYLQQGFFFLTSVILSWLILNFIVTLILISLIDKKFHKYILIICDSSVTVW